MNEKNFFYPRITLRKWKNFEKLLSRAKIYVYWRELNWYQVVFQIYDGVAVYSITQPESNSFICGEKLNIHSWTEDIKKKVMELEYIYGFIEGEILDDVEM